MLSSREKSADVFDRHSQAAFEGFRRDAGGVRREHHVVEPGESVTWGQRLDGEHIQAGDLMQASAIMASFVYNAATRPEMLPRKPLPPPKPAPKPSPEEPTKGKPAA